MANERQWIIPGDGAIHEEGTEEYIIPGVGPISEDQEAAVANGNGMLRKRSIFYTFTGWLGHSGSCILAGLTGLLGHGGG